MERLRSYGPVVVAFSGGVDSAVVAKAAYLAHANNALAVTASSPSLASGELDLCHRLAEEIGIRHDVIQTNEFRNQNYERNAGDRCYFCKSELYEQIDRIITAYHEMTVCNGANLDDQGDYRPGMQAAAERAVKSPLLELGYRKSDVRALAEYWELSVWDKPAMPCLSSRVAYGVTVTPEKVRRIDAAESFLKEKFNLQVLRVRYETNDLARIEVPETDIETLLTLENRRQISRKFRDLGFQYVTVDLEGFRSGSMNQTLNFVDLSVNRV